MGKKEAPKERKKKNMKTKRNKRKNNMKSRVAMIAALVLVAAITAVGTWAYLQQKTEEVKNTFNAAELLEPDPDNNNEDFIKLDETKVKYDPETNTYVPDPAYPDPVKDNTYDKIIPGTFVMKDPLVSLDLKQGINAYLFLEIKEENLCGALKYDVLSHWTKIEGMTGNNGGTLYYYSGADSVNGILRDDYADDDENDAVRKYYILTGSGEGNLKNGQIEVEANADNCTVTEEGHTHFSGNLKFYSYVCQAAGFTSPQDAFTTVFPNP